jgi:hypothetical protein
MSKKEKHPMPHQGIAEQMGDTVVMNDAHLKVF